MVTRGGTLRWRVGLDTSSFFTSDGDGGDGGSGGGAPGGNVWARRCRDRGLRGTRIVSPTRCSDVYGGASRGDGRARSGGRVGGVGRIKGEDDGLECGAATLVMLRAEAVPPFEHIGPFSKAFVESVRVGIGLSASNPTEGMVSI